MRDFHDQSGTFPDIAKPTNALSKGTTFHLFGFELRRVTELRSLIEHLGTCVMHQVIKRDHATPDMQGVRILNGYHKDLPDLRDAKWRDMANLVLVPQASPRVSEVFAKGYCDYLTYPFTRAEVRQRIKAALNSFQEREETQRYSADEVVDQACQTLMADLTAAPSLVDLCRCLGTNRNSLNRRFTQALGAAPMTWLRQQRCNYAAQLIAQTDENILTIALKVGYGDANNFSTAFRKTFACAPSQYRKQCQTQRNQ